MRNTTIVLALQPILNVDFVYTRCLLVLDGQTDRQVRPSENKSVIFNDRCSLSTIDAFDPYDLPLSSLPRRAIVRLSPMPMLGGSC